MRSSLSALTIALTAMLGLAIPAKAGLTVDYTADGPDSPPTNVTVTVNVVSNLVSIIPTNMSIGAIDTFLGTNSSGSFDIVLTPFTEADTNSSFNPTNWSGTSSAAAFFGTRSDGWGIGPGANGNINPADVVLWTIDTSNLNLATNEVFTWTTITWFETTPDTDGEGNVIGDAAIAVRTGATSGTNLLYPNPDNTVGSFSPNIEISGGEEFAFWRANGGGQVRLQGMTFEIRTPPTTVEPPTGLVSFAADSRVLLDWTDDITGFLDFYNVYRSTNSPVTTADIIVGSPTDSEFLDTTVTNGVTYYYAVSAVDLNGVDESALSAETVAPVVAASTDVVLFQHLEGSDINNFFLGDYLTWTWFDNSPNNHFAVAQFTNVPSVPSAILSGSGLTGVEFLGDTYYTLQVLSGSDADEVLDFSPGGAAMTNSGFAALVAFTVDTVLPDDLQNAVLATGGGNNRANGFGMRYRDEAGNNNGNLEAFFGDSTLGGVRIEKDGQFRALAGDTIVYGFNFTANTGDVEFWDSKNDSSATNSVPLFGDASGSLRMGGYNDVTWMDGMVGEMLIFQSRLSASEFESQRDALVTKWGATVPDYFPWADGFGVGGPNEDDDGDNLENFGEYALGGNPTNALDVGMQPTISQVGDEVHYTHVQRTGDPNLIYQVQTRQDLVGGGWEDLGFTPIATNVTGGTFNYVTNRITGIDGTGTNTLSTLTNQTFVRLAIQP